MYFMDNSLTDNNRIKLIYFDTGFNYFVLQHINLSKYKTIP